MTRSTTPFPTPLAVIEFAINAKKIPPKKFSINAKNAANLPI